MSFIRKIEKAKHETVLSHVERKERELLSDLDVITFECKPFGKYLSDKFNGGNPFTKGEAAILKLPMNRGMFYDFERKGKYKKLKYTFNELKYFKNAVFERIPEDINSLKRRNKFYPVNLTELTFPSTVTELPKMMFFEWTGIRKIDFDVPSSLTRIRSCCFYFNHNILSVRLPDGVQVLESSCFASIYQMTEIIIPDSVIECGQNMFSYCTMLKKVRLSNSMVEIPKYLFQCCYVLQRIDIPESIRFIRQGAFDCCYDLKNITVHSFIDFDESFHNMENHSKFCLHCPKGIADRYRKEKNIRNYVTRIISY